MAIAVVRHGIHSVTTFSDPDAEVIALEISPGSASVAQTLLRLPLPKGAVVGGILRGDRALVPSGLTSIRANDHLIVFTLPSTRAVVESLFS